MKKILILMLLSVFTGSCIVNAQRADYNVIPLPKEVKADSVQMFTLCQGM